MTLNAGLLASIWPLPGGPKSSKLPAHQLRDRHATVGRRNGGERFCWYSNMFRCNVAVTDGTVILEARHGAKNCQCGTNGELWRIELAGLLYCGSWRQTVLRYPDELS